MHAVFGFFGIGFWGQQKPNVYECAVGFQFVFCSKFIHLFRFSCLCLTVGVWSVGHFEALHFQFTVIFIYSSKFHLTAYCPMIYTLCCAVVLCFQKRWQRHTYWQVLACAVGFFERLGNVYGFKRWHLTSHNYVDFSWF